MGIMGGGESRRARQAAEQTEQNRQARITNTTGAINAAYDAPQRKQQYADFVNAVRQRYTDDANRQKDVASRQLKFSNARGGNTGGSTDVDTRRTLGEEYSRGILDAEGKAQGSLADLQAQDEQSRQQLIGLAQSGLDQTTAAQRAGASTQFNAASARDSAFGKGLGEVFGGTADIYKKQQEAAAFRRG